MQKKLILIITFLFVAAGYSQKVSEKYTSAMEKYEQGRYADAYAMLKSVVEDYGIDDELYASAHYYAAQSLIKLGEKDEAAAELEFIVNNISWSNFREEAYYYLGLINFPWQERDSRVYWMNFRAGNFPVLHFTGLENLTLRKISLMMLLNFY